MPPHLCKVCENNIYINYRTLCYSCFKNPNVLISYNKIKKLYKLTFKEMEELEKSPVWRLKYLNRNGKFINKYLHKGVIKFIKSLVKEKEKQEYCRKQQIELEKFSKRIKIIRHRRKVIKQLLTSYITKLEEDLEKDIDINDIFISSEINLYATDFDTSPFLSAMYLLDLIKNTYL